MERVEDGGSMPSMFQAGISSKFSKRHLNFRDTTLTAASAAKHRAERKLERQADAIDKQQQKIDSEMQKIAEITQNLHRQQLREAKRLRSRLNYAVSKIQAAYRRHLNLLAKERRGAAICIQTLSRGFLARSLVWSLRLQRESHEQNCSSEIISRCIRKFAASNTRAREIELKYWAACSIEGLVRIAAARLYVNEQRCQQQEAERQHRAAIVIQCNARSFMTRLIYLDVLYLICRIQAAMRGYLVRKQLRWLRSTHVKAISKLQAHIRGFLVRRRTHVTDSVDKADQTTQSDVQTPDKTRGGRHVHGESGSKTSRSASGDGKAGKNGFDRVLGRSSTGLGLDEPTIKRSYWLPAGASFDKRLPVLPVPKRMIALERGDSLVSNEHRLVNQSWTPKKRPHQKPCPVRLSPVVIPSDKSDSSDLKANKGAVEEVVGGLENEERLRRQEELKQKLQLRRNQEKRQQEHELKLKHEAENEANERKLMEREEKAIRLQLKILRRRSKEGKIRQVTADQRREERERLAMTREERHVRLHIKFCARQQSKKRLTASTHTSESDCRPSSTRASRSSMTKSRSKTTTKSKKRGDGSSDEDGDMSFLDSSQGGNNTGSSQSGKERVDSGAPMKKKKTRLVRANSKLGSSLTRKSTGSRPPLPAQTPARSEQEDDCGYGDEFDDVVDEAALSHLIC